MKCCKSYLWRNHSLSHFGLVGFFVAGLGLGSTTGAVVGTVVGTGSGITLSTGFGIGSSPSKDRISSRRYGPAFVSSVFNSESISGN